jgi:3-isopropylmalate/(R)-2-methylmalate dehydratase large subunit
MGMTMTQKILASHAGRDAVRAGDFIEARVDLVLGNDITAPVAIREFARIGVPRVFDKKKVVLVPDHFAPNKDIKAAEQCRLMREFARQQGIVNYFEVGAMGIEHVLLPEKGLVVAGDAVVGADSHTCTYGALGAFATGVGSTDMAAAMATGKCWFRVPRAIRFELEGEPARYVGGKDVILHIIGLIGVDGANYRSMEFSGMGLRHLSMDSRLTMANMAIEAGAKNGIFPVDESCAAYLKDRAGRPFKIFQPDGDADYERVYEIDLGRLRPTVACPHLPANTRPAAELGDVAVDQVVIGSCTNGRLEDLRVAAALLKGRRAAPWVRTIVIPGTQEIYLQALREGLIETFIAAGAAVSTPTCGPCLGGHMGILARGERALSTTNRNFRGRMGHADSEIYLAGPAVAAATAVTGRITDPSMIGVAGGRPSRSIARSRRSGKGGRREN